jgi:hypothetical protein
MNIANTSSIQSMAQEATETAAQTKAEAAKGDRQAIRKLAQEQAAHSAQNPPPATNFVDSTKGQLDIKA